ncbi:MAG: DnaJ C-terminal domain-containing protein [Steroidobacteraceae bacterium]
MEFKDYYATLGVAASAPQDEIKRAYRRLARKFHPDVSKEPDAEARFKEVAEAHEALIDPERRAAYDLIAQRRAKGEASGPLPAGDPGFEFSGRGAQGDFSSFFDSLFGSGAAGGRGQGSDHHARIDIDLRDTYAGIKRTISLRMPTVDARGLATFQERELEVSIPKGIRSGQHLRLSGQGGKVANGPAGDLYLEIHIREDPVFRLDGRDVYFNLPVAPWEAVLGASVAVTTPAGAMQMNVPPGSPAGRKLRMKGKGLPGKEAGDLYAVLTVVAPPAITDEQKAAYLALAGTFADYHPRAGLETDTND